MLHLTAPVHVVTGDGVLHVRRMGLAMLAYIALEGPTRRERLADVIWGHRQALRNLRVELHRLRAAFDTVGMTPLQSTVDPLALAPTLEVAPLNDASELLVGLEDISTDYQAWVEHRRSLVERSLTASGRDGLLDALSGSIRPPFVLVVQGLPGSGRRTLAQALAHRLHMPFEVGPGGGLGAVRYLPPELHGTDGVAARIRHDHHSVWVIGRSAYGVDSQLLLELRASLPAERWHYEKLRPLTWLEAKRSFLGGLAFDEGAPLYLASGGHPGYLRELVALRGAPLAAPAPPVPQRVRAALALEARDLSEPGRQALEHLSVFGGRFSRALVAAVGAEAALEELELHGWLRFEDDAWRFADPVTAKVLRAQLPDGVRDRLRRLSASPFAVAGDGAAPGTGRRAPHGRPAGRERRIDAVSRGPEARATAAAPPCVAVVPGHPLALDVPRRSGSDVELFDGRVVWSRLAAPDGVAGIAWPLPGGRLVARLVGRVAMAPDEEAGPTNDPTVLRVAVRGTDAPNVSFAVVDEARATEDAQIWLPAGDVFEHWLLLPRGARDLELTCPAASVIVDLVVSLHRVEEREPGPDVEGVLVAIDMSAASLRAPSAPTQRPRNPSIA